MDADPDRYRHLPPERLPTALADVHRATPVGAPLAITVVADAGQGVAAHGGRPVYRWQPDRLADVVTGAGFEVTAVEIGTEGEEPPLTVTAWRARTLPDYVGPGMRLLLCGLNPSIYSADRGVNYARPGNRLWPALLGAGLAAVDRDPTHALRHHGVGMTDLVKRATVTAGELTAEEYAAGVARVTRLCEWLRPAALCLVGLAGWRSAVDRRALSGWQPEPLGGAPVYVMPSTSGLNASTQHEGFVAHLRAAAGEPAVATPDRAGPGKGSGT